MVRAFFHITLATKMDFQLSPLPQFLALPGEPQIPWSRWHESFETLVAAIRLTGAAEARRRAVLIHSLGNEGQRIFRTLGPAPTYTDCITLGPAPTYTDCISLLAGHFAAPQSVMVRRIISRHINSGRLGPSTSTSATSGVWPASVNSTL